MERYFETVIIGAGPAGAACGITLRRSNKQVCLIDRAVFPRNKTCAGLVTGKTYALIRKLYDGTPPDDLFCCEASEVRLYQLKETLVKAPLQRAVRLVSRSHFDNALVDLYRSLGGEMIEGERRLDVNCEQKVITLSNGDSVRCQTLIFADGALSMSRRFTGISQSDLAFGVEAYIPSQMMPTDSIDLYFGYLQGGYVWAFPHGDTVCVGAANRYQKEIDYRGILAEFLRDKGVDPDSVKYIGAFLPYGKTADQNKLPQNVLLIGDAAGLTDPILGEGLFMALASGIKAAQSVGHPQMKKQYLNSISALTRIVREGRKTQSAFHSPMFQRIFQKRVKDNSRVVSFFFENMVDFYRYSYHDMPKLYKDYKKTKNESCQTVKRPPSD